MNLVRSTSFLFLILLIESCSKPADSNSSQPEKTEQTDPSKYILDTILFEHSTQAGVNDTIHFKYSAQNLVTEINWVHWVNYVQQNGQPDYVLETVNLKYTYEGKVPVLCEWREPRKAMNIRYRYNGDKLISRAAENLDPYLLDRDSTVYMYSADGRPAQAYSYNRGRLRAMFSLTYTTDEAIVIGESLEYPADTKGKYAYSGFDNKSNFMNAVPGYPKTFITQEIFRIPMDFVLLPGNYTKINSYGSVAMDKEFPAVPTAVTYCTLEYNAAGLPISKKDGLWTMKFKYHNF